MNYFKNKNLLYVYEEGDSLVSVVQFFKNEEGDYVYYSIDIPYIKFDGFYKFETKNIKDKMINDFVLKEQLKHIKNTFTPIREMGYCNEWLNSFFISDIDNHD